MSLPDQRSGSGPVLPAAPPALRHDEIHIWLVDRTPDPGLAHKCAALLSAGEQQRAAHLQRTSDRYRFQIGRAALRLVLAMYTGQAPDELCFAAHDHGKPALTDPALGQPAGRTLHFNISHSHNMLLCAVAHNREIGVDIEYIDPLQPAAELADLARAWFSIGEQHSLRALPERERMRSFYRCWTRKEACVKACGAGLAIAPPSFDVAPLSGPRLVALQPVRLPRDPRRWFVRSINFGDLGDLGDLGDPAACYAAALAAEGNDWSIDFRRWFWPAGFGGMMAHPPVLAGDTLS